MKYTIFVFMVIAVTTSCKPEKKVKIHPEIEEAPVVGGYDISFNAGRIYNSVVCRNDVSQSYALYLPPDYDTAKTFPVIYFIDPHADGLMPVTKYKTLAEKFHFIFAGSNNSKNGNTLETNAAFINNVIEDVRHRFSVDDRQQYVAGFSGGSRVASFIALNSGEIRGVIAMGGGMVKIEKTTSSGFYYIGIAGLEDFNATEMISQKELFSRIGLKNDFLMFDGKHEWCPVDILNTVITGLQFDAMQKKIIPYDKAMVENFIVESNRKVNELKKKNQLTELNDYYSLEINFLKGLADVEKLTVEKLELENSGKYIKAKEEKANAEARETVLKEQYAQLFLEKNSGWWSDEIKMLQKKADKAKNENERLLYKRVINYLSLVAYMYSDHSIKNNDLDGANRLLDIYKMIDPQNSEHAYLHAKVAARKNETETVFTFLNEAVDLGFKDLERLKTDNDFYVLKNNSEFAKVELRIRQSN
ncbi:MAG: hypothetical protein ACHQNT_07560 [Bacteroidia bacterium]